MAKIKPEAADEFGVKGRKAARPDTLTLTWKEAPAHPIPTRFRFIDAAGAILDEGDVVPTTDEPTTLELVFGGTSAGIIFPTGPAATSDDIVDRLRVFEGSDALENGDFSVCDTAADHIEALRQQLADARDALERIANWPGAGTRYRKGCPEVPISENEHMAEIAEEALARLTPPTEGETK